MNVMQEKAKQRNITPNFLRFRRTPAPTQAKAPPTPSAKSRVMTIELKRRILPKGHNVHSAVPHAPADAALKHTNDAYCT